MSDRIIEIKTLKEMFNIIISVYFIVGNLVIPITKREIQIYTKIKPR